MTDILFWIMEQMMRKYFCVELLQDAGGRITSILEDPDRKYEPIIKEFVKTRSWY